jgi:hypothetical protein
MPNNTIYVAENESKMSVCMVGELLSSQMILVFSCVIHAPKSIVVFWR